MGSWRWSAAACSERDRRKTLEPLVRVLRCTLAGWPRVIPAQDFGPQFPEVFFGLALDDGFAGERGEGEPGTA